MPLPALHLNSHRYRRILIACLATLFISAGVLGVGAFARWQTAHAVKSDTQVVLQQAVDQLRRALESRRGTLTLLRDTLDRVPQLTLEEQTALSKSAVAHTRHLLGLGLIGADTPLAWWHAPSPVTAAERAWLTRAILQRLRTQNIWRVPTTFSATSSSPRTFLIMLEPLKAPANATRAVVGIFDVAPLLQDFFELTLQQPYPIEVLDDAQPLYRSPRWQPTAETNTRQIVQSRTLQLDGLRWSLHMQPGTTRAAQTLSWMQILSLVISVLAGLATIGMIWLLAMRTWILQRAVTRRTAALRRTTERLRQLATTDELTGLYNRRFFLERWQWEYERATRYDRPLGCLMIDVDQFKRINDILGHHTGDLVLKHVAQELKRQLRQSDFLARLGGHEFVVALPETSLEHASAVAEKLRELILQGPWTTHQHVGPVRLSVGVSHVHLADSAQHILQHADANLYASRHATRSRAPSSTLAHSTTPNAPSPHIVS